MVINIYIYIYIYKIYTGPLSVQAQYIRLCPISSNIRYNSSLKSKSELPYDLRFAANQFVLATSPLRLTTSNFIFQVNTCDYSPYVTSSLMRGWVCRLQLLMVRVPRSSGPYFAASDSRFPQPGGPAPRIYILQDHTENTALL
jgi:hypothetical protein